MYIHVYTFICVEMFGGSYLNNVLDHIFDLLRIESHGMLESTTPPTMFAGAYSMLSAIIKRGISEDASMAQADFSWPGLPIQT